MSLKGNNVVGLRREDKSQWERRVPLTPDHVRTLVDKGLRIIVQPSTRRVFPDGAYAEAGAEVSEDLSPASTILAVKEVPPELLIPERTYVFFSHTIKAQRENMPLLDDILKKNIRMIDYECITETGERGGRRLVAFGRYAGIAGAVDYMRGLGERLLGLGFSSPFLNVGAAYMYPNLDVAFGAIRAVGSEIAKYGLPSRFSPFIVGFTGRGNVSKGAQEVFELLPHQHVKPTELPDLVRRGLEGDEDLTKRVYLVEITSEAMVRHRRETSCSADALDVARHIDGKAAAAASDFAVGGELEDDHEQAGYEGVPLYLRDNAEWFDETFDRNDYRENPEKYEPVFHSAVAPYLSVLVNCMYWDSNYPRLLTVDQTRTLVEHNSLRMIGVCDISCDRMGSVEFLREFTSIDKPFYIYDPLSNEIVHDSMVAPGLLFHAVDHLPSEVPADASRHFGDKLLHFIPELAASDGSQPFAEQTDLPKELRGAIIAAHGRLTPQYDYIAKLRESSDRAAAGREMKRPGGLRRRNESFLSLSLRGHLFDSGVINKILDLVEDSPVSANITDINVGKDQSTATSLQLSLFAPNADELQRVIVGIRETAALLGTQLVVSASGGGSGASAMAKFVDQRGPSKEVGILNTEKRILLLGAGFVTAPLVEYLLRRERNFVTVASVFEHEAKALCKKFPRCTPTVLNVSDDKDKQRLHELLLTHDAVVSLVPAPLHPHVARVAIETATPMVTASYVSAEMAELDEAAKAAGICILNEVGLDPGIDHMSAVAMLDEARAEGHELISFSSVCGGLPAPEAANNVLGYKFSWSPRGVLTASKNPATWLHAGNKLSVAGKDLLASARPFRLHSNPAFRLECLPNRDSTAYRSIYSIEDIPNIFRGTLRYRGFSLTMHALASIGFLEQLPSDLLQERGTHLSLRAWLALSAGVDEGVEDSTIFEAVVGHLEARRSEAFTKGSALGDLTPTLTSEEREGLMEGLRGLGLLSSASVPVAINASPLDTLAQVLQQREDMMYAKGERDMALMQHEVIVRTKSGAVERRISSLCQYADDRYTAMAQTVGVTAAISVQLILDNAGGSKRPGVARPVTADWYRPILRSLSAVGIEMRESVETLTPEQAERTVDHLVPSSDATPGA